MATQVKSPTVTVIDPVSREKAKLRVAAYARVSSDSADQLNSYLAQVDYYTHHIGENPDWELVDIYADEGISGLDTHKRDEFNRMMADCRAGKIDRILVKSMSRFARNTRDTLHFMRELMRLGVTVRFEKENIDTGRLSSEQTATIYAAFAQMESGTSTKKRTHFNKMIRDDEKGKIDLIITKSVSRFCRNTLDGLEYIRRLKKCGVGVYFEKENTNTLYMANEMMPVSFLASVLFPSISSPKTGSLIWSRPCGTMG